uniref:Uncharacterized protein n=1 Tax=Nothoprocta perdicaria TaxID=30464 RepID=A0A8C7A8Q1_NOTPE
MSACSDFVEHVWKPGSCKNCFNAKSSHRAHAHGPPGAAPDDDGVAAAAAAFSKPTIAVRPTMMSADVSDTWADVTADLAQVIIKPGSGGGWEHRACVPGMLPSCCLASWSCLGWSCLGWLPKAALVEWGGVRGAPEARKAGSWVQWASLLCH